MSEFIWRKIERAQDWLILRLGGRLADDQTGHPWPACVCNDHRYEAGHMETCPCYGLTADMPSDADLHRMMAQ